MRAGQIFQSLSLRDYLVTLVRRFDNGYWLIDPAGSSAHGSYSIHEDMLADPKLYRRVEQTTGSEPK